MEKKELCCVCGNEVRYDEGYIKLQNYYHNVCYRIWLQHEMNKQVQLNIEVVEHLN